RGALLPDAPPGPRDRPGDAMLRVRVEAGTESRRRLDRPAPESRRDAGVELLHARRGDARHPADDARLAEPDAPVTAPGGERGVDVGAEDRRQAEQVA